MIDELLTRREAPVFFAARDYWTARSIFVRGFEVRRMDYDRFGASSPQASSS
jgi:hypothetical protein